MLSREQFVGKVGNCQFAPNKRMQLTRLRRDVNVAVAEKMVYTEQGLTRGAASGAAGGVEPPRS
jgi:hypothetical protein